MKIGEIAAAAAGSIEMPYMPAVLHFDIDVVPSAFKVNVLGDGVVLDLDAAGISVITRINRVGNLVDQYVLPLADGILKGKNVSIEINNPSLNILSVYGYSEGMASTYIRSIQQKVFANSGVILNKFQSIGLPSMAAADELNITYRGGFTQKFSRDDLRMNNSYDNYVGDDVNDYRIDNQLAVIKEINFIPAADQQIYLTRYAPIGNF